MWFFRTLLLLTCLGWRAPLMAMPVPTAPGPGHQSPLNPTANLQQSIQRNLSGLQSIRDRRDSIAQPFNDFDKLYDLASHAQQELSLLTQFIARTSSTEALIPGVKSRERAFEKVTTELAGDASQITDLARATVVADDIASLVEAFELLESHSPLVQVKNRFSQPGASGYRDLKVLVQLPDTGMIAELQFHLRDIATIKSGPEHHIYEQIQKIERRAQQDERYLSEFESLKIAKLREESRELYHQAWQQYVIADAMAEPLYEVV